MDCREQQNYVMMLNNVILKTNNNEIKTTTEAIDVLINHLKTTHLDSEHNEKEQAGTQLFDVYNVGNL